MFYMSSVSLSPLSVVFQDPIERKEVEGGAIEAACVKTIFDRSVEMRDGASIPGRQSNNVQQLNVHQLNDAVSQSLNNCLNTLKNIVFYFKVRAGGPITLHEVSNYHHASTLLERSRPPIENIYSDNYCNNISHNFQKITHSFPKLKTTIPCLAHFFIGMKVKKVIDVSGGNGYLAGLLAPILKEHGIEMVSIDLRQPKYRFYDVQVFQSEKESFEFLEKECGPDCALLFCWPPMNNPMAAKALAIHEDRDGRCFSYIGEEEICGNPAFYQMTKKNWGRLRIPERAMPFELPGIKQWN